MLATWIWRPFGRAVVRQTDPWGWLPRRGSKRRVLVKLLEDVEKIGEAGEYVAVKPGRMRHDLYPNKKAAYALYTDTPTIKEKTKKEVHESTPEEVAQQQLDAVVERLTTRTVVEIRRPLRPGERQDVAITAEILCRFVRQKMRIDLAESLLDLPQPIQTSGEYEIPLRFSYKGEEDCALKVRIVDPDDASAEEEA